MTIVTTFNRIMISKYLFNFLITALFLILPLNLEAENADIYVYLQGVKVTDIKNDGVDIWVATEGNGIYKYISWKNKWVNYSSETKKIKQNFFYCIEIGPRYIWAGSADGLYIYDKKRDRWSKKRFTLGGQFGNWIRSLKFDKKENKLWIGRFKYLSQFDLISKKYKDYDLTVNKNEKTNTITDINLDGDSVVWIGVEAGVHKYNKRNLEFSTTFFDSKKYFLKEGDQVSVTDILLEQNNIWFGTAEFVTPENPDFNKGGLFRYDRKINWIKFDEFRDLNGSGIYSIELSGNYIWSSVYKFDPDTKKNIGKGLHLINRKSLEVMKVENNLIPETIFDIHFDGKNMWLGTNNGIVRISLTNNIMPDFN